MNNRKIHLLSLLFILSLQPFISAFRPAVPYNNPVIKSYENAKIFDFRETLNRFQYLSDDKLHGLRQLGSATGCIEILTDHAQSQNLVVPSGMEAAACALTALDDSLKIYDYAMYPNLILTNQQQGHLEAFETKKAQVEAGAPYYFLMGCQLNPQGSTVFKVAIKLRHSAPFDEVNEALEAVMAEDVRAAMESTFQANGNGGGTMDLVGAEIAGMAKMKEFLQALIGGTYDTLLTEEKLKILGFREMKHSQMPQIENTSLQFTTQSNLKDYAGLKIGGDFISDVANQGIGDFQAQSDISVLTIITDNNNYSAGTNNAFSAATNIYNSSTQKLKTWIHYFETATGTAKIYLKYEADLSEEEADAIIDASYAAYKAGSNGYAKPEANAKAMVCPNLNFWSGDSWSTRKDIMPCIEDYIHPFIGGIMCGIIDGFIEPLSFLASAGGFLFRVYENTPFISASWWISLYDHCVEAESISAGIMATFADNAKFWGDLVDDIVGFVENIFSGITALYHQICEFFEEPDFDISFEIPTPKDTGYFIGSLIADIAITAIMPTNVTSVILSKMEKLQLDKLANAFRKGAQGMTGFIKTNMGRLDKLKCKLLAYGCFTAGTLVATPEGQIPIAQIVPGDRVITHTLVNKYECQTDESNDTYSFNGRPILDYLTSDDQRQLDLHGFNGDDMKLIKFQFSNNDGSATLVNLVRPIYWLKERGISGKGDRIWLRFPEMGIEGLSEIVNIENIKIDKPINDFATTNNEYAVAPVTGTIERNSTDLLQIIFEGNDTLQITGTHPLYSLTKKGWTVASQIEQNEEILGQKGIKRVLKILNLPGTFRVYNLEVGLHHNFLVAKGKLLAHNKCPDAWNEWLKSDPSLSGLLNKLRPPGFKKLIDGPYIDKVKQVLGIASDIIVCIDDFGFPDFLPFVKKVDGLECIVEIDMEGNEGDFTKANDKLREKLIQSGSYSQQELGSARFDRQNGFFNANDGYSYTWHHHQDGKHMMLVPTPIHSKMNHLGGNTITTTLAGLGAEYHNRLPNPWATSALWKNLCN